MTQVTPKKSVIFGLIFLVMGYVAMLIIFLNAILSPAKMTIIRIDAYSEAWFELAMMAVSLFCVPMFIREVVRHRIVVPFWMREEYRRRKSK